MNSGDNEYDVIAERFARFDCVVLRGLPGIGKSTLAMRMVARHEFLHLEADQHFMVNGVYRFDPALLAGAHAVVAQDALTALRAG